MLSRDAKDHAEEKMFTKEIKKNVKNDREQWLQNMIRQKDWTALRGLRKPPQNPQGRLNNANDEFVPSNERADTLADFFEHVQWRVRPNAFASDKPPLHQELEMDLEDIKKEEVRKTVDYFKKKRRQVSTEYPQNISKH